MAASLGVTTEALSAGTADLGPCDTTGVTVDYDVAYSSTLPGYAVTDVRISGIDHAACAGQSVAFTVVNAANGAMVSGTKAITAGNANYSFTSLGGTPDFTAFSAQNAENIHAIIHTPTP